MTSPLIDTALKIRPVTPSQLVLALHMSGSANLEIALPGDWNGPQSAHEELYLISDGFLKFETLGDRNKLLANTLFSLQFTSRTPDFSNLLAVAHDLWGEEIGRNDFASGRFLVEAGHHIDVLRLAAQQIREQGNVFDVLQVVEAYFEHATQLNIESIVDLTRAQNDETRGDIMGGMLFSTLGKWLAVRPDAARVLYSLVMSNADDVTASLVCTALIAISKADPDEAVNLSLGLLDSNTHFLRSIGIWICGLLLLQNNIPASRRAEIEKVLLAVLLDENFTVRLRAIGAATGALHLSNAFDEVLAQMAQAQDQETLALIAQALYLKSSEMLEQGRFDDWLPFLVNLIPTTEHLTRGLDHVLSLQLVEGSPRQSIVLKFLTDWTLRHTGQTVIEKVFVERFGQCVRKLVKQPNLFAMLLTDWLSNDSKKLAAAAAGVLSHFAVRKHDFVQLDIKQLNIMDTLELQFLVRRIVGYVHDIQHLLSIGFSFLQMDDSQIEKSRTLFRSLFVDEIGYDYPGTTVEALKQAEKNESRPIILSALVSWRSEIEASQQQLELLPRLKELRPPSQLQRQFVLARSKQMEKARKEGSKNSIVSRIATQIPLKAGRGFFNHSRGHYSEPSELKTVSYSIEFPRREVLDPVGNAIRGFQLRNLKKNAV